MVDSLQNLLVIPKAFARETQAARTLLHSLEHNILVVLERIARARQHEAQRTPLQGREHDIVIITVIILDAGKAYAQTCVDLRQMCLKKHVHAIALVHILQGELGTATFLQNRRQPSVRSTCPQAHGQEVCECFLAHCYMVLSAAACILGASMA